MDATQPPSQVSAWLRRNPVTLKELRGQMRGVRAFVVLTIYLALMSAFAVVLYLIYVAARAGLSTTGGVIGKLIFGGVLAVELFMVCFIAPAFTTGAISGEKERQTFDLLRTTLLPARRIVLGKLMAAMAYIVLLLVAAVPLQSLAFLMGGITPQEVLLAVEILLVTGVGYATLGIFFSALARRTLGASVLTYIVSLLVTVALPVVLLFLGLFIFNADLSDQPILEAILIYGFGLLVCINPISTVVLTETTLQQHGSIFWFNQALGNGTNIPLVSPWIAYTIIYAVLTLFLIARTVHLVRRINE